MPSPREEDSDELAATGPSARSIALRTAVLVGAIFVAGAVADRHAGAWLIAATVLALLATLALFRDVRPLISRQRRQTLPTASQTPSSAVLLAAIPEPVILVDRRGVVIDASPSARKLFPALRIAQPLSFGLRAPDILEGVESVMRDAKPVVVEFSERVPVERVFEVHVGPFGRKLPAGAPNEAPTGFVLSVRDITDARRLEYMRMDFVANASHELRTPLASVMGFIETLQGPARNDPAARERFLGIMREQAQRMARLIDDLLSLSRIELNVHVRPEAPVDILGIVKHILDTLSPLAHEHAVVISLEAPPGPIIVPGERDELLRVFENLIENAVKYGQSGGRVLVRIVADLNGPGEVVVSVRDFGPGIAPEHLPRLTERFYRVNVAASREKGGTGLGLAIVKHIVNHHRGRLVIESELGRGAIFRVILPTEKTGSMSTQEMSSAD